MPSSSLKSCIRNLSYPYRKVPEKFFNAFVPVSTDCFSSISVKDGEKLSFQECSFMSDIVFSFKIISFILTYAFKFVVFFSLCILFLEVFIFDSCMGKIHFNTFKGSECTSQIDSIFPLANLNFILSARSSSMQFTTELKADI